ncbi:MAG TPA: class I SAM-dependent methyltransferase [Solirubrobacteraceae bacterium]|nr:class I SAM-dependent methyltransferase [Solirubrobacteraceae bacterium]
MPAVPLPPEALVRRVGWDLHSSRDPGAVYLERGSEQWALVKSLLPEGFELRGRRVLDFGSGAGRIVRHALTADPEADYWACDIDERSVAWMAANLEPPLHPFRVGAWPPAAQPDGHFGLIFSFSVFTHLLDEWSAWLLELHRLLADDGIAVITVFGPGIDAHGELAIHEEQTGMNFLYPGANWDEGGPLIVHSEWWLRAHWGRAFEILALRPGTPTGPPPLYGQGAVVMRKRPGTFTVEELERWETDEPRELAALRHNVTSLRGEGEELRAAIRVYESSRSWRLTKPLRGLGRIARGGS